jgi:Domain of unknown function (DUF4388)
MAKTLQDHGILDVIRILSTNGDSGRLQINSGMTEGAFFFSEGQLVDARVGSLTGFQAVNALASMRDANFSFDPTIPPPSESSITASERVLLKQFFGIEAVDRDQFSIPEPHITTPAEVEEDDEVTLVRSSAAPRPVTPIPASYGPPSKSSFRTGLIVAAIAILLVAAGTILLYKFGGTASPAPVATAPANTPAAPPAPVEQAAKTDEGGSTKPKQTEISDSSAAPDLTGNWKIINTVEQTSYQSYKNMQVGFNLSINQNGNGFTGRGEKVSENGRSLPASGRTPIVVNGSINGDRVEATFVEEGAARKTNGRFVWRIDKAGAGLNGTFSSTAARARGKSAARREL